MDAPLGLCLELREKVQEASFGPDGQSIVLMTIDDSILEKAARENPASGYAYYYADQATTHRLHWCDVKSGRKRSPFGGAGSAALRVGSDRTWGILDRLVSDPAGMPVLDLRSGMMGARLPKEAGLVSNSVWGNLTTLSDKDGAFLWDLASGEMVNGRFEHIDAGVFHPITGELVTLCGERLEFRDPTSGQVRYSVSIPGIGAPIKFSPQGVWLSGRRGSNEVVLLDPQYGQVVARIVVQGAYEYKRVEWSSDSRAFAVFAKDEIRLFDAPTGRAVTAPIKQKGEVHTVQFHPTRKLFLSALRNGAVHLFDGTSGQPVGPSIPVIGEIVHASFSPDGESILTATSAGRVQIWQTPVELGPMPDWISKAVACSSGYVFSTDGELVSIPMRQRLAIRAELPNGRPKSGGWGAVLTVLRK